MATITLGTTAQTTLTALAFQSGGLSPADIAKISQDIKDDLTNSNQNIPEAFSLNGLLYIPNRGVLKVLPGDVVGVDGLGWPILIAKRSAANATYWKHS